MGKRIIIGSMLVLILLLLMPSIPAIQQRSVEEGIRPDIQEKLDKITLDAEDLSSIFDRIKLLFLFIAIMIISILMLSASFSFFLFMLLFFS